MITRTKARESLTLPEKGRCENVEEIFKKGNKVLAKGKYDDTVKHFEKVISLSTYHKGAWNNEGLGYRRKGGYDEAIKMLWHSTTRDI